MIMKNDRLKAMDKLLKDRDIDMFILFSNGIDTNETLKRLETYKGIKRFYYTGIFLIETFRKLDDKEKLDKYQQSFDISMNFWSKNVVSSSHLERLSIELLIEEGYVK